MLAAWLDGERASAIPLDDRGLHYGDGLFETIAASAGRAHFLSAHLERLAHGCVALSIPAPDARVLGAEVRRAAALAPHVIVKVIVTRGASQARGYACTGAETPRRIVCAYDWPDGPDAWLAPARVDIATLRSGKPVLAGVKHLNRLEQVLARHEARQRGLDEVILLGEEGHVSGGSMTNVFALADGQLVTPPVAHCAVAGIMRAQLLAAAPRLGLVVRERPLDRPALDAARALWLANARVGLWPVVALGPRSLAVHAWTAPLQAALRAAALEPADA